ncbi:MAG: hypothetical protein FJ265_13970 [Planctomycetes bacterium]|nr:hypothetical protein [Planctomycetota bacterium]
MTRLVSSVLFGGLLLAACSAPPPRPWLRYVPDGPTTWVDAGPGVMTGTFHGAPVTLDLGKRQTRVEVEVRNTTAIPIEFRMGPEGAAPRQAIGEVLLRQFQAITGPDMLPYNAMQPVAVPPGWRAVFYLDAPLGREPGIGQFFVLTTEARDPAGKCERRNLPLRATNAGTLNPGSA